MGKLTLTTAETDGYLNVLKSATSSYATGNLILNGIMFTADGGVAVQMVNKTGGASVKGTVVTNSTTTANGFQKIIVDVPNPIGVVYQADVADGSLCWVTVTGKAKVYFVGDTTLGHFARGFLTADGESYVTGQALSEALPASPFTDAKHFYEICHVIEARTGAGLASVVLHFN